jgi:hypothetical protein
MTSLDAPPQPRDAVDFSTDSLHAPRGPGASATVDDMTHRLTTFTLAAAMGGLLFFLTLLFGAPAARALAANGHGPGYLSSTGWWLGSYTLDDGSRGFCLQAGRPSPLGHPSDLVDGDTLGWFTSDQAAQLAYVSRNWAGTDDRTTAAAGQLATWIIAGLNDRTPEFYAERAGTDGSAVLARAHDMIAEAERESSRGVTAEAEVLLTPRGTGTVQVELIVDRLSGPRVLPPSSHTGHLDLVGARFEDGSTSAAIANGVEVAIIPTGDEPSVSVSATATFTGLPYGDRIRVAVPHDDAQALLVAVPASAAAQAGDGRSGVSPLPFQPRVETVTSEPLAQPGEAIFDHLVVSVDQTDGLLPHWGLRAGRAESGEGELVPVEAVVESSLLGPFSEAIAPAATVPDSAPIVCTVELVVSGPGDYDTPECILPSAGYYVWVERIDPARTPADEGGSRMLPWQSAFGAASEITRALEPEEAPQAVPQILAATGADADGRRTRQLWFGIGVLAAGTGLVLTESRRRRAASK